MIFLTILANPLNSLIGAVDPHVGSGVGVYEAWLCVRHNSVVTSCPKTRLKETEVNWTELNADPHICLYLKSSQMVVCELSSNCFI